MPNRVPPDSPAATIIAEEERLFGRVQARAALGVGDAATSVDIAEMDRELIELRDQIAEAKPEDIAPLVEQMTRLAALRSRVGGSRTLPIDVQSPYFAHMVLRQDGTAREVLVGKRGFIDRKSNVQIVDWRNAPISQVYYRYDEGDDYEEEIAGRRVQGVVQVRRNISIFGGKLRRIGAPQGTFIRDVRNVWHQAVGQAAPALRGGQGTAVRVPRVTRPESGDRRKRKRKRDRGQLGVHHGALHRADKSLPEIAALIDREQFDLITQPDSGVVVIQGGAGSGKTTVALHRIAYLNFHDPARFRADQILFVVPSRALVKYVSGVLPSLGVRGVPVVTYEAWARNQRRKLLPDTGDRYNADTPDAVSRLKKHPGLLAILDRYVAAQVDAATAELEAAVAVYAGAEAVLAEWRRRAPAPLAPRLSGLRGWLRESGAVAGKARNAAESAIGRLRRRALDVVTDWSEVMTDEALLAELVTGVRDSDTSSGDAGDAKSGEISAADVRRAVTWCERQARGAEVVVDVAGDPMSTADGRALDEGDPSGQFDVEDDPILLRLIQLKRGRLAGRGGKQVSYEHVAIDEAQDRSAIEVKVLLDATRMQNDDPAQRSLTIAGDTAQRLVFDNSFTGWEALLASTGHAALVRPLSLSYRSTAEVMHFARAVLGPELAPVEPLVARSGEPVTLHQFGDIGEAVAFLADALRALAGRERTASVAVIARHPEQAEVYFAGLERAEVPALRLVRHHDFAFVPGVDVTDVTQVKGLEFDYVVMVEVNASSYPATVEARHLLHIGATRAAHQLWLISTDRPSVLLPDSMRDADADAL